MVQMCIISDDVSVFKINVTAGDIQLPLYHITRFPVAEYVRFVGRFLKNALLRTNAGCAAHIVRIRK